MIKKYRIITISILTLLLTFSIVTVKADDTISTMTLTEDQEYILSMMTDPPLYYDLTLDTTPKNINLYFERLSFDGEWEAELIADYVANAEALSLMVDYTYPFQLSFKTKDSNQDVFTYLPSLTRYPKDAILDNENHFTLSSIPLDNTLSLKTSEKQTIANLFLIDNNNLSHDYQLLSEFDYHHPDIDILDEVMGVYSVTIELIE